MTSESIFSGLHHLEGAFTRVYLVANLTYWGSKCLFVTVTALRGVCHKGPKTIRGLCHLNLCYLLVLENSHSSSAYLVPQTSRFMAGEVSHFVGDYRHHMHATVLTVCAMKVWAFFDRLSV